MVLTPSLRHQLARLDAAQRAAERGVAVLAILHDLNLAERYADTLVLMNKGKIVTHGAPAVISDQLSSLERLCGRDKARLQEAVPSRWLAANETGAPRNCVAGSAST